MKIIKWLLIPVFLILGVGYGAELGRLIVHLDIQNHNLLLFLFGCAVFIPIWLLLLHRIQFLCNFEHEFTHMVACLLCFNKPTHFHVNEKDGEVGYTGRENFFISLAPYFLPTLTCILVPFYYIIKPNLYVAYFLVFGLVTSYHMLSGLREFSYAQPDIVKSGRIFSTIFLLWANIMVVGLILTFVVAGGFGESWQFLKNGFLASIDWIIWLVTTIRGGA